MDWITKSPPPAAGPMSHPIDCLDLSNSSSSNSSSTSGGGVGTTVGATTPALGAAAVGVREPCSTAEERGVNLYAPGREVYAAFYGGGYASVTSPGAAASITAGAAALIISKLGQRFGGAVDGWAEETVSILLSTATTTAATSADSNGTPTTTTTTATSSRSGSSGNSSSRMAGKQDGVVKQKQQQQQQQEAQRVMDLPTAMAVASERTGPVVLRPSPRGLNSRAAALAGAVSVCVPGLQFTWHVNSQGVLNPDAMMRIWQKQLPPGGLWWPIMGWEFQGTSTVVVLQGWLEVEREGVYRLSAASADGFLVYLEGRWVYFEESGEVGKWSTPVEFTVAGEVKGKLGYLGMHGVYLDSGIGLVLS